MPASSTSPACWMPCSSSRRLWYETPRPAGGPSPGGSGNRARDARRRANDLRHSGFTVRSRSRLPRRHRGGSLPGRRHVVHLVPRRVRHTAAPSPGTVPRAARGWHDPLHLPGRASSSGGAGFVRYVVLSLRAGSRRSHGTPGRGSRRLCLPPRISGAGRPGTVRGQQRPGRAGNRRGGGVALGRSNPVDATLHGRVAGGGEAHEVGGPGRPGPGARRSRPGERSRLLVGAARRAAVGRDRRRLLLEPRPGRGPHRGRLRRGSVPGGRAHARTRPGRRPPAHRVGLHRLCARATAHGGRRDAGVERGGRARLDLKGRRREPPRRSRLRTIQQAIGHVVWGGRTLQGADRLASEWKYIPMRRMALFLEESLYRGTRWVIFEPNGEPLWAQIRLTVGAFMHDLFRRGAFQGTAPRDAYFVKCDAETTTQSDIDQGIESFSVGFAPVKPAEFIIIRISHIAGDAPI